MTCESYAPLLPPIPLGTRSLDDMTATARREQCNYVVLPVETVECVADIINQARQCSKDTGYNFNLGEFA